MKPWCGYVRVSHVGDRSGDSFRSPEDQTATIEGWVKARGETVVMLPPELDASGGDSSRAILSGAVEAIERGEYRGLVVAYLSRASRSVKHLLELWDRIERAGGQVVAVSENIDTSTPAGRLTRTMLAAIAEHELDLHRDRFEDLRASATERGIWQRRQTPLGYDRDPETRKLVPNADAKKVRRAYRRAGAGDPIVQIASDIGMSNQGLRYLLRNRVYLGELHVGSHVNRDAHPAILTLDEYEAAQRDGKPRRPRAKREPALLAGLIRCEGCGHVMARGTVYGKTGKEYPVYSCSGRHSAGTCPSRASVMASVVHPIVEAAALRKLEEVAVESVQDDRDATEARAELAAAEAELAAYLSAVSAADIGPEAFGEGAAVRRARVVEAEAALRRVSVSERADLYEAAKKWPTLSVTHQNELLSSLVEVVVVRKGRIAPEEKVRVFRKGSGVLPEYRGGSLPRPIERLPFPDHSDPRLLGV